MKNILSATLLLALLAGCTETRTVTKLGEELALKYVRYSNETAGQVKNGLLIKEVTYDNGIITETAQDMSGIYPYEHEMSQEMWDLREKVLMRKACMTSFISAITEEGVMVKGIILDEKGETKLTTMITAEKCNTLLDLY